MKRMPILRKQAINLIVKAHEAVWDFDSKTLEFNYWNKQHNLALESELHLFFNKNYEIVPENKTTKVLFSKKDK